MTKKRLKKDLEQAQELVKGIKHTLIECFGKSEDKCS